MKRLSEATELLDGTLDREQLKGNLRDLERVNRWLGGERLSWRALEPLLTEAAAHHGRSLRLLDVGTGAGDIPHALLDRANRAGHELEIVASDTRPEIVQAARRRLAGQPTIRVELSGPGRLDHPAGSFDVIHASLVLHHLEPAAATDLLAEAARLATRAVIVNDLFRRVHSWLGAWLLTRVATRNRYTRHDGPLSVRRAYQPAEVAALARPSGLRPERLIGDRLGTRYALVLRTAEATRR